MVELDAPQLDTDVLRLLLVKKLLVSFFIKAGLLEFATFVGHAQTYESTGQERTVEHLKTTISFKLMIFS
jgi:hypothetical protein